MSAFRQKTGILVGHKLVEIPVSDKTVWHFLVLRDDNGKEGYGECSYDGAPNDIKIRLKAFVEHLIGSEANRACLNDHQSRLQEGLLDATLFSTVEQALADLESRAAGKPLWRHLGGTSDAVIPLYANINRRTASRSSAGFVESALAAVKSGFSRIKIAPFDEVLPEAVNTSQIEHGLDRIGAVRDAIGDLELMIDCHWRFRPDVIRSILPDLSGLKVSWLECPIAETQENISEIVAVRRAAQTQDIRLAGLETAAGWQGFQPFVEAGAYDVIMPDIKHCGGHSAFLEISERAIKHGAAVSAHNPSGPIAHLASLHATAAIGAPEPLEVQFDESPLFFCLTDPPPPRVGCVSQLPGSCGLGVKLIPEEDNQEW